MIKFLKRLGMYFIGIAIIDIIGELFYAGNLESTVLSGNIRSFVFIFIGSFTVTALSLIFDRTEQEQSDEN